MWHGNPPGGTAAPSFNSPFAVTSPWKAQPVSPVLGTTAIPSTNNFALVNNSDFGAVFYHATASDGPMNVTTNSISDELIFSSTTVTIPHFPAGVVPPTGTDGHTDIYDDTTGTIHSFWAMTGSGTSWHCFKYTTTQIDSLGVGSPERPDESRAGGCPPCGGLLRSWEFGLTNVNHALAIALGDEANFANGPIFPATMQDVGAYPNFTGPFPYGTLFMLPATFDLNTLATDAAKAIARTLMQFGGYLMDRTVGAFAIFGEVGSGWSAANNFNGTLSPDMTAIRNGLRAVTSTSGWLDANGNSFTPLPWDNQNLISMRGPWTNTATGGAPLGGAFNTVTQQYEFANNATGSTIFNQTPYFLRNNAAAEPWDRWATGQSLYWNPIQGASYTARTTGTGTCGLSFRIHDAGGTIFTSGSFSSSGSTQTFTMPTSATFSDITVSLSQPPSAGPATIKFSLIKN